MVEAPLRVRPGLLAGAAQRHWRVVVLLAGLGALLGASYAAAQPASYTSQAAVFLEPLAGNPFAPTTSTTRNDQLAALETEIAILGTTGVLDVARAAEPSLPADSLDRVAGSVPSNSQVLQIRYAAGEPDLARLGAQTMAEAYLTYRTQRSQRIAGDQTAVLQQQADETAALLAGVSGQLEGAPEGSATAVQLEQQVQLYASQLSELRGQVLALSTAGANPGEVITAASEPSAADGFPASTLLVLGLLLGGAVGGVLALLAEHRDDRIHDVRDVSALATGPALSSLSSPQRDEAGEQVDRDHESYRSLADAIVAALPADGGRIGVCGVGAAVESSRTTAAIGRALVRSGHEVVLVAADSRDQPEGGRDGAVTLAATIGDMDAGRGGVQHLDGENVLRLMQELEPSMNLVCASDGRTDPDHVDDLLQSPVTDAVLSLLGGDGTVVLLALPASERAAAPALARDCDSTLLIVTLGVTTFDEAFRAIEVVRRRGGDILGVVARRPSGRPPRRWVLIRRSAAGRGTAATSNMTSHDADPPATSDLASVPPRVAVPDIRTTTPGD